MTCRYQAVGYPLEAAVLGEIAELLETATATVPEMKGALRRASLALSRTDDDAAARVRTYEQAAGKARERIKRLALLFADGDIDRDGYELGRTLAQADLEAAEGELAKLRAVKPPPALPTLYRWFQYPGRPGAAKLVDVARGCLRGDL